MFGPQINIGGYIEDEDKGEAEYSDRGSIEVGVDVVAKIDIPDGMFMLDVVERLKQPLATYEATRAAKLVVESQSQNGDDGDNENGEGNENINGDGNGGGNGNGNGGGNGNGNPNRNDRGVMPASMEAIFHISNCPEKYQVKYATCTLLNSALTWWNAHKRTIRADVVFAMSWRELMKLMTEVYCPRNEIHKMETKMVPEEEDRVKKFIGGLPDNIDT
ncbi:hypothetical protein Tco_0516490 [Tanacetum coccineum]